MAESADNGKKDTKSVSYAQIKEDLKKRKPLLAATQAGDPEILERVKHYEEQTADVAQAAGLVAAKGEDIEKLALLDSVTELYNHRTFAKELKAEIVRATRYEHVLSICMLTVDNFDSIGEQYGLLTQDAVLRIVGNVIRASVREMDVAARYAPLQFGLILPQSNSAMAAMVAERIRRKIASQVFSHNWENFSITASAGISTYPFHGNGYEELIARSIEALECAAERGGDRVFSF